MIKIIIIIKESSVKTVTAEQNRLLKRILYFCWIMMEKTVFPARRKERKDSVNARKFPSNGKEKAHEKFERKM